MLISRRPLTTLAALGAAAVLALGSLLAPPAASADTNGTDQTTARPSFRVPFPCRQEWRAGTRANHRPANAVDFNRGSGNSDLGLPVKASAAGTVASVSTTAGQGYGLHIVINHGDGWSTLYAHLQAGSARVKKGDRVSATTTIANVGKTGLDPSDPAQTSHLHYEQRQGGNDVRVRFGSYALPYPGEPTLSRTRCG
ncbi:M23 family peptidase [Desertihabitans brevis]|uniref:M23 family peptidase n=1 Tax=Desertihabitans brevis TaxID=2268447 RepID=A0A367YSN6_9ACTN|nr:M23 family metallopeptidase [Desertihabitans brevis]RCK68854.1 M23 family peptidase [Desertihabitans brevis]